MGNCECIKNKDVVGYSAFHSMSFQNELFLSPAMNTSHQLH